MAYQSTIPQPTDRLRTSQGDLLGNFAATSGGLGTMLNPNQGYIQFPNQGGNPTFTGAQPGFFAKTAYGVSEIFVNRNIVGPAQQQIPITASTLSTTAPSNGQATWFFLPGGYLVKTGEQSFTVPAPTYTINFPVSPIIPVFTTVISTQVSISQPTVIGPFSISYTGNAITKVIAVQIQTDAVPSIPSPMLVSYTVIGIGA